MVAEKSPKLGAQQHRRLVFFFAGLICPAIGLCLGTATVGILRDSDGYFMFRIGEGY